MNPSKAEHDHFHHRHHHHHDHRPIMDPDDESQPSILDHLHHHENPSFSIPSMPEIILYRDDDDDSLSHTSSDAEENQIHTTSATQFDSSITNGASPSPNRNPRIHEPGYINPEPHISSQFYTFNSESHALMIHCILQGRLAYPDEIRVATPRPVLASWRSVWKDRNEDTAYLTAWKRIQDKLNVHTNADDGNKFLCFKNNSNQFVSHTNQWQDIVMSCHSDDLKHLGVKETIERIKQLWTVGAKFYGIPESFIRVCVNECPVCSDSSGATQRSKRRRFEYTESFDVPAKEVPHRLQQLAAKHKVVLCIRQKYIRYKPFMAEVKDYACHRAGEPASAAKKSRILKREPYASKRCGCGFRIRAIVPIANYNEKDKTFVYQEEGMAVFKLYAVHSGHEPGPLDGNARIMHRVVGHKGGYLVDPDTVYGLGEAAENESSVLMGKDDGDLQHSVLHQVQELRNLVGSLEGKIAQIPHEQLGSVSQELFNVVNKLRRIGECSSKPVELLADKLDSDDMLVGESDLADWGHDHHENMYGDGKDGELLEEEEDSFERTMGSWEQMRTGCRNEKDLLADTCKSEKWLKCDAFDDKSILGCSNSKITKRMRDEENIITDVGLVGLQVDSFYPENPKWYDSPCGLDPSADCDGSGFSHGGIV